MVGSSGAMMGKHNEVDGGIAVAALERTSGLRPRPLPGVQPAPRGAPRPRPRPSARPGPTAAIEQALTASIPAEPPVPAQHHADDLARSSVRGTLWLSVQAWSVNLASLVVFVVLGRLLTPDAFGLVGSASVVVLLLRTMVDAGVSKALIRAPKLDDRTIDTAFWLSIGVGAVLLAAYCALAPVIALLFGQPRLTLVLLALSPIIAFAALDRTQSALLDRAMRFRVQATRSLAAAVISAGVAIAVAFLGFGIWSLVLQSVSFEFVSLIFLWTLTSWRPRLRFSRSDVRELLGFGARNQAIQILGYLSQNLDNFLIGIFLGPIALGIYVVGYRVLIVLDEVLSMTLRRVALPAFSRVQHDPAAMRAGLARMGGMAATIILPSAIGVLVVAPHLVPVVFGAKWLPSVGVMQALVGAAIVQSAIAPLRNIVLAAGHARNEMWWTVGFTTAELVGFAAAAQFNVYVVAILLSTISLLYWPLRVWSLRALLGVRGLAYWRPWLKPLLAAGIMGAGVALVDSDVLIRMPQAVQLAASVVLGVVLFAAALLVLDRGLVREIKGLVLPAR